MCKLKPYITSLSVNQEIIDVLPAALILKMENLQGRSQTGVWEREVWRGLGTRSLAISTKPFAVSAWNFCAENKKIKK
ncbi:MAG: hypothetical protein H8E22_06605 [Candidatus Cloacimonetes bacterium]|nr:hypothetical protein [Candidatus Cloacimonadota bacterium]